MLEKHFWAYFLGAHTVQMVPEHIWMLHWQLTVDAIIY